jgi:hypothetical protein
MNELDPAVTAVLDRLSPVRPAAPDWPDVLASAGARRRTPRSLALAALVLVLALLAAPAFGLGGPIRTLLGVGERQQLRLVAKLRPVAGSGSGSGEFVATPLRSFRHVGSSRVAGFTPAVSYTLRYRGLSGPVTSARLRVRPMRGGRGSGFTVRLCGPCPSGAQVVLRRRGIMLVLLTGRGTVEVATRRHPGGELRGRVLPAR